MHDGNYIHLIPEIKTDISIRMVELLSKIEEECQGIAGKNSIFIFGNTGAGKSCLTNYLIRAPMTQFKNKYE